MLDLMELRGFRIEGSMHMPEHRDADWMLYTPDGFGYAILQSPDHSLIEMAFAMFQKVNHHYL